MRVAFLGGTGLYELFHPEETLRVDTPYGATPVTIGRIDTTQGRQPALFLNRHGDTHRVPPHRIDHRRNIDALHRAGADTILAVHNTGGLQPDIGPGHLVIPHDFVDLTARTDGTFYDDDVVHIDLSTPYCPHLRQALQDAVGSTGWPMDAYHAEGVYVATRGPRLETAAEVNFLATLGDIVGMTGCPEAALARERGMCYASLSFVANAATGRGAPLKAEALREALAQKAPAVRSILIEAARRITADRDCACRAAATLGTLRPVIKKA